MTRKITQRGFTMIELLVVSTIIIVVTAIGLVSYTQVNQSARNGKRKADLENLRQSLVIYRTDIGTYPNTSSFATMLSSIASYTSGTGFTDPKNVSPYVYTYTSNGSTFTLCGTLEPSATPYCLNNP